MAARELTNEVVNPRQAELSADGARSASALLRGFRRQGVEPGPRIRPGPHPFAVPGSGFFNGTDPTPAGRLFRSLVTSAATWPGTSPQSAIPFRLRSHAIGVDIESPARFHAGQGAHRPLRKLPFRAIARDLLFVVLAGGQEWHGPVGPSASIRGPISARGSLGRCQF